MRKVLAMAISIVPALACADGIKLTEDKPPVPPAKAGDVGGVIAPAANVTGLKAVSRVTLREYQPNSFDRKTGEFLFKNLPGDARYDICFRAPDGRRIEGIDLDFVGERMLRLSAARRKHLGLPAERFQQFGPAEAKKLIAFIADMKDFMEIRRVLYIKGRGIRATMLVELMRTRDFYSRKGSEVIWRVELWYFKNHFGGWDKLPNQERILHRLRTAREKWQAVNIEYFPQLSAYVGPDGKARKTVFKIPPRGDPSRGRLAGTAPEQKTASNVLGLPGAPGAEQKITPPKPK